MLRSIVLLVTSEAALLGGLAWVHPALALAAAGAQGVGFALLSDFDGAAT